jgi:dTDP-4-amino-4,6-dideoxygalactose transaminase
VSDVDLVRGGGSRIRSSASRQGFAPRFVGPLGGTTTLGDCLVALRHLLWPNELIQGPAIAKYEEAFARAIGVRYAYSFWAGRVGLYSLLLGLGLKRGDEVLLQVPTHVVVANAIRYTGARPVYVDCEPDSYNIDLEQAERQITPRTKVLLLQHTFGNPVDLDRALALAARHNLEVVEDCVHALGAAYRGRPVGSFGRAAFFSTEETKTISSTMGGMVVTDDPELADRVKAFQAACTLSSASQTARYMVKFIAYFVLTEPHLFRITRALYELMGRRHPLPRATTQEELHGMRPANYEQRLSNAQAALALRQLQRLDANVRHRRAVSAAYSAGLGPYGYRGPRAAEFAEPALVRHPIWVEDRPAVMRAARRRALLGDWFTSVLEEAASPHEGAYERGSCPRAEAVAEHLVNLPNHARVKPSDVEAIISTLAAMRQAPKRTR